MALSQSVSARVRQLIDVEVERVAAGELARAAERLSRSYRGERTASSGPHIPHILSAADRAAYLAVRMPATLAAVARALELTREQMGSISLTSVLDVGAGPGTATIAALDMFPEIDSATLVERDLELATVAARTVDRPVQMVVGDVEAIEFPAADLVICAYLVNELRPEARMRVVERAWNAAEQLLILIEPGSRAGFANILAAREHFIARASESEARSGDEARILAPCPAHMACSLAVVGDWCHFSARVERSSLHRRLKGAELSYEDEKFSFLSVAKKPGERAEARIVRRPEKLTGHVKLELCTPDLLQPVTVTKKHGALYKIARHAEWGDAFRSPVRDSRH